MDSQITAETADKVAAAITRSPHSKSSVAQAAGIPYTSFTRKINGHTDFTVPELARVAKVLGVPPSSLLPAAFTPAALSLAG